MNLTDAVIALLLTAKIHGTDESIRATAKRIVKQLPRSKRETMFKLINSKRPLLMVELMAQNLEP